MNNLKTLLKNNNLLVLSKSTCPYCKKTKALLKNDYIELSKKFTFVELNEIKEGRELQKAAYELTGQSTVPNIFIDGTSIGGYTDLRQKVQTGEFDKLVSKHLSSNL